ncbi:MAG: dihydrodipicolinate synthase family protein [Peptococcaceae bacterium]|nr:dihydrodipicolinate synthase family protein [Peptococcaceae bacterium]
MMIKPSGSWVAIPTPFDSRNKVDFGGFRELVDFHVAHGTSMLFCMGSAGEVTMLTPEERYGIIPEMVKLCRGRIPVFFGSTMATTEATVKLAQYAEKEGADGLVFSAPYYLLPSAAAVNEFFLTAMSSVALPVGVYNNPSRTGVMLEPEMIAGFAERCPNFVVDKEAMPSVGHLCEVKRRLGDRVSLMCCDFPKYSILLPLMAMGGQGAANIGGNVIPEEMALMSKAWDSIDQVKACRDTYLKYYDLLKALYFFSNPVCIKAALRMMGLPAGGLRKPYQELGGDKLAELRRLMEELGVFAKYGKSAN